MILIQNVYYMLSYAFKVLKEQGYKDIETEEFENAALAAEAGHAAGELFQLVQVDDLHLSAGGSSTGGGFPDEDIGVPARTGAAVDGENLLHIAPSQLLCPGLPGIHVLLAAL